MAVKTKKIREGNIIIKKEIYNTIRSKYITVEIDYIMKQENRVKVFSLVREKKVRRIRGFLL